MVSPGIRAQFIGGLELLYGAHHQGAKQAAENLRSSTSPLLRRMVRAGAKANIKQAERLEDVFASFRLAGEEDLRSGDGRDRRGQQARGRRRA